MEADLKRTVEALLSAAPESLSLNRMQSIIPRCERRALRAALAELAADYDKGEHAFQLAEMGGGWRIVTRPEYARRIEAMLKGQRRVRLSRAALECLAVVAYRQPCTRVDVEAVRGVNSGGSLATLTERGMIRITGRAETLGRPLLYTTTESFLSHLGINDLADLPQLAEIEALLTPRDEDGEVETLMPGEERRDRLVAGMESIAELMIESAAPAADNGNGTGQEDEWPEQESPDLAAAEVLVAEEPEHAALLKAGLEEDVEQLCEGVEPELAEAAAAAAAGEGTLAMIAKALEPEHPEGDTALPEANVNNPT